MTMRRDPRPQQTPRPLNEGEVKKGGVNQRPISPPPPPPRGQGGGSNQGRGSNQGSGNSQGGGR